jgi:hypothetical protein
MEKHPAVQTIARVPGGWSIVSSSGSLFVPYETANGRMLVSRRDLSGVVEVLPINWSVKPSHWRTFAASPNGDTLYLGTSHAQILMHKAPWSNEPEEILVNGVLKIAQLRPCQDG